MPLQGRAILYGFLVSLVLTIIGGFALPFTDASIPTLSSTVIGLIAGGVAGYVSGPGMAGGALNGAVATTIGSIIGLILAVILGTALGGLIGVGAFFIGAILVLSQMIPGAIGGAIGSYLR